MLGVSVGSKMVSADGSAHTFSVGIVAPVASEQWQSGLPERGHGALAS